MMWDEGGKHYVFKHEFRTEMGGVTLGECSGKLTLGHMLDNHRGRNLNVGETGWARSIRRGKERGTQ
jgi:hypothetical protein